MNLLSVFYHSHTHTHRHTNETLQSIFQSSLPGWAQQPVFPIPVSEQSQSLRKQKDRADAPSTTPSSLTKHHVSWTTWLYFEMVISEFSLPAGVAQCVKHRPDNQKVARWFLVRARAWVAGLVPSWGCARGDQAMFFSYVDISLLHFLLPVPSL